MTIFVLLCFFSHTLPRLCRLCGCWCGWGGISGTEPKFKYYIELRGRPGEKKFEVERRLSAMSRVILEELLQPSGNGLTLPSHL